MGGIYSPTVSLRCDAIGTNLHTATTNLLLTAQTVLSQSEIRVSGQARKATALWLNRAPIASTELPLEQCSCGNTRD